jgi:hypothetical protein
MIKRICSLAILILATFSGFNANAQQMYIGARIGANLANWSGDSPNQSASFSLNTGLLAGAQFDFVINQVWTLSCQLLYDQKGTVEHYFSTEDIGPPAFSFNYLEIPILLKADFGSGDLRPYIFGGPSFGIYLSGSELPAYSFSNTPASIPDSTVRSPDISAVFGTGLAIKLNSGQMLFVDAADAFGLVNIFKTQQGNVTSAKSRDIRIATGILFPLN